jgi:hypothetical protein
MHPLHIQTSHSSTPVRGHPSLYGAHPPAGYPYRHYAMPPHSHMPPPHPGVPPPPPGYALVPFGDRHDATNHGNPVSPDAQGTPHSKHQFDRHGRAFSHYSTPDSAARHRTPSRTPNQGSPLPFNPSTATPSQRVLHPPPLGEPYYAPGKFV